jgi:hypothetical protein
MTGLKTYPEFVYYKGIEIKCVSPNRLLPGDTFYFRSPLTGKLIWAPTPAKARKLAKEHFVTR